MKTHLAALVASIVLFSFMLAGQQQPEQPTGVTIEQVVQRFAARETEFKHALENYAYRQELAIQTLNGNSVDGEYRVLSDVTLDGRGRRHERLVLPSPPTLQRIMVTKEDLNNVRNHLPFVLTSDEVPEYDIVYVGLHDDKCMHCYVLDLAPKRISKEKPQFQGRIWVDENDFHIVQAHGRTMLDVRKNSGENLFPAFTTFRAQVDGKYWFPAYSVADDDLHFSSGNVHIRETVKYSNYKPNQTVAP